VPRPPRVAEWRRKSLSSTLQRWVGAAISTTSSLRLQAVRRSRPQQSGTEPSGPTWHNAEKLAEAASVAQRGDAVAAYCLLGGSCRLDMLGPAFGTKFLYRVGGGALIHDGLVGDGLERVASIAIAPTRWDDCAYFRYIARFKGHGSRLASITRRSSVHPGSVVSLMHRASISCSVTVEGGVVRPGRWLLTALLRCRSGQGSTAGDL
jgi:hypothetical protein